MASKQVKRTVKVVDNDKGWIAVMDTIRAFTRGEPNIITGVTGAEASAVHQESKKGETVATIAAKNEFGLGVPERSFIRTTFDENRRDYHNYIARGIQKELIGAAKTKVEVTPDTSLTLKRIALKMEGDIKKKIASRVPPPNAPSTIRNKRSSMPLIDTGQMRRAITSVVRKGGKRGTP